MHDLWPGIGDDRPLSCASAMAVLPSYEGSRDGAGDEPEGVGKLTDGGPPGLLLVHTAAPGLTLGRTVKSCGIS